MSIFALLIGLIAAWHDDRRHSRHEPTAPTLLERYYVNEARKVQAILRSKHCVSFSLTKATQQLLETCHILMALPFCACLFACLFFVRVHIGFCSAAVLLFEKRKHLSLRLLRATMPRDSDEESVEGKSEAVETKQSEGKENEDNEPDDGSYSGEDGGDQLEDGTLKVDPSREIGSESIEMPVRVVQSQLSNRVQEHIVDLAKQAMENSASPTSIAKFVKTQLDKEFHPAWHCIVGRNFGMAVSHVEDGLAYFYVGSVAFLVFKHSSG